MLCVCDANGGFDVMVQYYITVTEFRGGHSGSVVQMSH